MALGIRSRCLSELRRSCADRLAQFVRGGWRAPGDRLSGHAAGAAGAVRQRAPRACLPALAVRTPTRHGCSRSSNGATSIWERWNGWTPEQGFNSPLMNSFNHYAFGAVGDWMYRYLGGLDPVEPGYRRVRMRPRPGAGFSAASARHESLYGVHACAGGSKTGRSRRSAGAGNTSAALVLPHGEHASSSRDSTRLQSIWRLARSVGKST